MSDDRTLFRPLVLGSNCESWYLRTTWRIFLKLFSIIWIKSGQKWYVWNIENSTFWGLIVQFGISAATLRTFFKLWSKSRYIQRTKMACLLFPNKSSFWGKWVIWSHFGPKLGNLMSKNPCEAFFLKFCSTTWYDKRTKVICMTFPKKYLLGRNGQFGPFWC